MPSFCQRSSINAAGALLGKKQALPSLRGAQRRSNLYPPMRTWVEIASLCSQ
jgi:hypothetical protein